MPRKTTTTRKRATRGMGNARRRGNGWEIRVNIDGTRRSFYGSTLGEAQAAVERARRADAPSWDGVAPTVREWMSAWLTMKKGKVEKQTWDPYRGHARHHIVPVLGKVRLDQLTAEHMDKLQAHLARTVSGTTANHVCSTFGNALNAAERRKEFPVNVVTRLVQKPKRDTQPMEVLTRSEVDALIAGVAGHPHEALYVLAVVLGVREGELLGLRWKYLDLTRRKVRILGNAARAYEPDDSDVDPVDPLEAPTTRRKRVAREVKDTKSQQSSRTLDLPDIVYEAFARMTPGKPNDLVWAGPDGKIIPASTFSSDRWVPLRDSLGLSEIHFHDLRHTAATHMLEDGVQPHVVSTILGHSSVAITLRIYAHVTRPSIDEAVAKINRRFGGAPALSVVPADPAQLPSAPSAPLTPIAEGEPEAVGAPA